MTTTVSQEAREAEVTVREIETVTGDFLTEAGEPFYRIEINGYCADFDYREAAENFAAAINQMVARHRQSAERGEAWRPIETAPKDGTRFWGFWPVDVEVGQQQVTYFDQFTLPFPRFCDEADHIDWTQPTHWQPLPTPPEAA